MDRVYHDIGGAAPREPSRLWFKTSFPDWPESALKKSERTGTSVALTVSVQYESFSKSATL